MFACKANRGIYYLLGLLLLFGPAERGRAGQEGEAQRPALFVAGNDRILWLIVGRWEPGRRGADQRVWLQRLAYQDRHAARLRPLLIEPQVGRIERCAATGENLHVFFSNGDHFRYTPSRPRREIPLPGNVVPLAVAGERQETRLWALVEAETADAVEVAWRKSLAEQSTQPEDETPARTTRVSAAPRLAAVNKRMPGTWHLLEYDGLNWRPGWAAPADCSGGVRAWLCAWGRQLHLFWQVRGGEREIRYAVYAQEHWSNGPALQLSAPPEAAWALAANAQLFFLTMLKDQADPRQGRIESWPWAGTIGAIDGGNWGRGGLLENSEGRELRVSAGAALGMFCDQFVILQGPEDEARVGFWPSSGGKPQRPFAPVPLQESAPITPFRQGLRDAIAMLAVLIMLLLIWWQRRQSITTPIALPAGLRLAGPGKRAFGAMLDMLPVAALVGWRWHEPLLAFYGEIRNVSSPEQYQMLAQPAELLWAGLWFRVLYLGYCLFFELFIHATPGKRLLGCRVLTESLQPPRAAQLAIRNVTKLVELEPMLQIWPFMLVILFTRNNQRLGDLIARTIVVERQREFEQSADPDFPEQDD